MKKIFAIVLAMAMVLSLGTALAATWSNPGANTTAAAAVSIEVTKYIELRDAANTPYYSQLDDAAIVKAGDRVAFQAKIKVPSYNALNTQFGTDIFGADDELTVKVDGSNLANGPDETLSTKIRLTDTNKTYYVSKTNWEGTTADVSGSAAMYLDAADAYGSVDLKVCVEFQSALADITMKNAAGNKFYVSKNGSSYVVTSSNYRTNVSAVFKLSGDKVTGIDIIVDSDTLEVKKIDGVYQCSSGTDSQKFAGNDFMNMVLSILGFSAADAIGNGSIYMTDKIWAMNFGVYFKNCSSASYAAYTPVPVTVTPTTTIPKTGSNASVIGFAMVALAVVAAAVVAVKKVRA